MGLNRIWFFFQYSNISLLHYSSTPEWYFHVSPPEWNKTASTATESLKLPYHLIRHKILRNQPHGLLDFERTLQAGQVQKRLDLPAG